PACLNGFPYLIRQAGVHFLTILFQNLSSTYIERHIHALKQVHSQVLQDVAKRLDKAFQAFFRRVKHGEMPCFPRFKPQQRTDRS
ncbi:hypothetical protein ABND21_18080, partial [Paenibacillus larvae]